MWCCSRRVAVESSALRPCDENRKIFWNPSGFRPTQCLNEHEILPVVFSCFRLMNHHFSFFSTTLPPTRDPRSGVMSIAIINSNFSYMSKKGNQVVSVSAVLRTRRNTHDDLLGHKFVKLLPTVFAGQDDKYPYILPSLFHIYLVIVTGFRSSELSRSCISMKSTCTPFFPSEVHTRLARLIIWKW